MPLNAIESVDKKHWKNKGIAYGLYSIETKAMRICLDAHKFKGCDKIIAEVERRIELKNASRPLGQSTSFRWAFFKSYPWTKQIVIACITPPTSNSASALKTCPR